MKKTLSRRRVRLPARQCRRGDPAGRPDHHDPAGRAAAGGLPVGTTPKAGAVIWYKNGYLIAGGDGHVGFVEKVNSDGSIWVSDMNSSGYKSMDVNSERAGGWNRLSYRPVPESDFSKYLFIS